MTAVPSSQHLACFAFFRCLRSEVGVQITAADHTVCQPREELARRKGEVRQRSHYGIIHAGRRSAIFVPRPVNLSRSLFFRNPCLSIITGQVFSVAKVGRGRCSSTKTEMMECGLPDCDGCVAVCHGLGPGDVPEGAMPKHRRRRSLNKPLKTTLDGSLRLQSAGI